MNENKKPIWLSLLFAKKTDFYELLINQANQTLEGIEALHEWFATGQEEYGQNVRQKEKQADVLKLNLDKQLVESFITPFDREDIYELSNSMDEIMNAAKMTVRELEAVGISPQDQFLPSMSEVLVEGVRCLKLSFEALKTHKSEASNQASLARKSDARFGKIYRQATQQIFELDDTKQILKRREVYRCMAHTSTNIDVVGEKLLHAIIKMT